MIKSKKLLLSVLCVVLLLLFSVAVLDVKLNASACDSQSCTVLEDEPQLSESSDEIVARGIFTSISLNIFGGDGKVWATARNDVTLFPSTVEVYVYLYCSDGYAEDYNQMTLVASNYTADLNMGSSLTAEASTNGGEKYWMARVRYKADSKDWKEKISGPTKCNSNGDKI